MDNEDKNLLLNDLIDDWFESENDLYTINKNKFMDTFILRDCLIELHQAYYSHEFEYLDKNVFYKRKSKEDIKSLKDLSDNKFKSLVRKAQRKELKDMRDRALKTRQDMEANLCNTNDLSNFIRALNYAIEEKKKPFNLNQHIKKLQDVITKKLHSINVTTKYYHSLNNNLKSINQRYLKSISRTTLERSHLPKQKNIF